MDELRPCPFCGADREDIKVMEYYLPWQDGCEMSIFHLIYCQKCGGAMTDQNKKHCWNDRAAAWNRRADNA